MPRHRRRPVLGISLLVLISALLGASSPAHGADYTVRITTTAGTHWTTYGGVPFVTTPQRVYSGVGYFSAGDYKSWRMVVPGEGAAIVGGRIVATLATPDAPMRGRLLVGTGNSPVVLYDGDGTGTVERSIAGGLHNWIQFDLRATSAVRTTAVGTNWINLTAAELVMRDSVPPVVTPLALPSPTAWHGATACIPFSIRVSDQGGGLARATVRRAATGALVTDWTAPQAQAPKPGPTEQQLDDCIQPAERGHGDNQFIATVWDVSGVAREIAFHARADHMPPVISGGPAHGTVFDTDRPSLQFEVADDGAGIAAVSATIDGAPMPVTVAGSTVRIEAGRIALGAHTVAVTTSDAAGNSTRIERSFAVMDAAPPVITLSSPGARGEARMKVTVAAGDDLSGVDATTWNVAVDGEKAPHSGTAEGLTADLGPLQPGTHRIDVSVSDRAGNIARLTHTYYVIPPPPPPAPAQEPTAVAAPAPAAVVEEPGRSGLVVVDAPRAPVGFGQRTAVSINVARLGRPVPSQLVEVRREGRTIGSAVTDESGIARVRFAVGAPGSYAATAVGLAMEPVETGIKVAPRLIMTTSLLRPKVGQRVAVTGRIIPAIRGRRVAVEARIGGVWFPIRRTASTNAAGAFRSSVIGTTPGTVWVRVRVLAVGAWAPAVSNQRAIAVRRR